MFYKSMIRKILKNLTVELWDRKPSTTQRKQPKWLILSLSLSLLSGPGWIDLNKLTETLPMRTNYNKKMFNNNNNNKKREREREKKLAWCRCTQLYDELIEQSDNVASSQAAISVGTDSPPHFEINWARGWLPMASNGVQWRGRGGCIGVARFSLKKQMQRCNYISPLWSPYCVIPSGEKCP